MKVTLGNPKTQRVPGQQSKQKAIDHNSNFSNTFLKHQMFFKPNSQHGDQSPQGHYKEKDKIAKVKASSNGMGSSFVSGYSIKRMQKKEEENLKNMIVNLSHELLVKDSIIATLHGQIISMKGSALTEQNTSQRSSPKRNKHSYHFRSLIEEDMQSQEYDLSNKNSFGTLNQQVMVCQPFDLQDKATLSQSQFVKSFNERIGIRQLSTSHRGIQLFRSQLNSFKLNKKLKQVMQSLKLKDKQLQIVLNQKRLLSSKIVENQKMIVSLQSQMKNMKIKQNNMKINQSKKNVNIVSSKDELNRSIQIKNISDYQQKFQRVKKDNLNYLLQIQQLKRCKSQQIQSSIRQWKKINQTMTDSLVKLNQQNSTLTKKLTDLQIRYTTVSTKMVQLQKQNNTLKINLQNQKNSYNTLSIHHKHQKDQYSRKINITQKQNQKLKSKNENIKLELQRYQFLINEKQQSINNLKSSINISQRQYQVQISKIKQSYVKDKYQYQRNHVSNQQVQSIRLKLKQKQIEYSQQYEKRIRILKQLGQTVKILKQYQDQQEQRNQEVQKLKNIISQINLTESRIKIQNCKQKEICVKLQSIESSIEIDKESESQKEDSIVDKLSEENIALTQKINIMNKHIKQLNGQLKDMERFMLEAEKMKGMEDINKKLGEKIRSLENQLLSLKSKQKSDSERQPNFIQVSIDSNMDTSVDDFSSLMSRNKILISELQKRQQTIQQLRQNLHRQQDNTISVKLHLDDTSKRLCTHMQILQIYNKNLISNELKFGNYVIETKDVIQQLKQDNEGLQQELKVIYEKLEYFEKRLEEQNEEQESESKEEDQIQQEQENKRYFIKQKYFKKNRVDLISND